MRQCGAKRSIQVSVFSRTWTAPRPHDTGYHPRVTTPDEIAAGIYCRMSLARYGDATKTEDQERISRELAGHRGWAVSRVYTDNNKSARQRNRKRPGWDAMLADVEAGKLGAIIVYHGDRLVRQPWDLETLINLAYGKGVKLASPTGERDLSNDDDLFILRIEVAAQCRESASTSRRKKTEFDRLRRRGLVRPGGRGGRAFGFATDGVTHIPAEVGAIQETAVRVLEGEAVGAIARDLNSAGIRTPTGGLFSHATLRKMLARPRYAGLMPDGVHTAAWKPVLQRQEWEAVTAALGGAGAGRLPPRRLEARAAAPGGGGGPRRAGHEGRRVRVRHQRPPLPAVRARRVRGVRGHAPDPRRAAAGTVGVRVRDAGLPEGAAVRPPARRLCHRRRGRPAGQGGQPGRAHPAGPGRGRRVPRPGRPAHRDGGHAPRSHEGPRRTADGPARQHRRPAGRASRPGRGGRPLPAARYARGDHQGRVRRAPPGDPPRAGVRVLCGHRPARVEAWPRVPDGRCPPLTAGPDISAWVSCGPLARSVRRSP